MKGPNILIFVSDHFRKDAFSHMDNAASCTPNFDAMVKQDAISMEHAFCQNPVCVPSRCSFLSGLYPHVHGFRTMHHLQSEEDPNILKALKKEGYHIYFGGKNDVFQKDIPVASYCDYRSDAYLEMSAIGKGESLRKGYTSILKDISQKQIIEAEELKEKSRGDANSSHYYSLYQGVISSHDSMKIGYTGAEDAQILDAISYIENYAGEKPLCMYVSLMLPHPYYACSPEDYKQVKREHITPCIRLSENQQKKKASIIKGMREHHKLYQWSDEELLDFKQVYLGMIHHIDTNFGRVIQACKRKGCYEDMAILMFSDHGDYAGDYEVAEINQNTFEDVLSNVPLIIKPPKHYKMKAGRRNALCELVDIPATLADLANITLSHTHFGKSLLHLFKEDEDHKAFVTCEGGRLDREEHCKDGGHQKSNLYWARTNVQECMPEHTKATMLRNLEYKYVYRLYELDEFYDLKNDPQERVNEINNPLYKDILTKMKMQMLDFYVENADVVPNRRDER